MPNFGKIYTVLDDFDRKLLAAVQQDADRTAEELAEVVPLSASAIARRIRRLKENGAIVRTTATLDPALSAAKLRAIVRLQLHEHAPALGLQALREQLEGRNEVQLCLEISGEDDMLLLVACRDMDAFNDFADTVLASSPVVRRYETNFVKKDLKNRPAVILDQPTPTSG